MISIGYAIKQAFKQVLRNRNMTSASVFSITSMMIILGLFFILAVNVNMMAESAKGQFDTIQVWLKDTVTLEQAEAMRIEFENFDNVGEAIYVSKDDAMEIMVKKWGDNGYLLESLSKNPLPASIEISLNQIELSDGVVAQIQGKDGIEDIKYSKTVIDKILSVTGFIQTAALVIIGILVIVSVVVVSNTVKLTVHAREREITIMKYVGATNWFIRGPFLVEGMLIGFISSVISSGLVGFSYYKMIDMFAPKALSLFSVSLVPVSFLMMNIVIIFIALGVTIGALGSILSMRKFLDT